MTVSRADPAGIPGSRRRGRSAAGLLALAVVRLSIAVFAAAPVFAAPVFAAPVFAADGAAGGGAPIRLTPGVPSVVVPSPVVPPPAVPLPVTPEPLAAPPSAVPQPAPGLMLLRPSPSPSPAPSLSPAPAVAPRLDAPLPDPYPTAAPGAAAIKPGAVTAQSLGAPDPDGAGLVPPGQDGLRVDLWAGLSRGEAMALLSRVPVGVPSPAARALLRRLLLAEAVPPAVPEGEMMPARRFGAVRVETLAALGDPAAARALAARVSGALEDETTARALVDAGFIAGAPDCPEALGLAKGFKAPHWRRVEVYCHTVAGNRPAAELALAMLQEGPGNDPLGDGLAEAMATAATPPPLTVAPRDPPVITLAMMAALEVAVPPETLKTLGPARMALAARNTATDPVTRVTAAERAAQAGFLDVAALAAAYAAVPAQGDELGRLGEVAKRERSPRLRGLTTQGLMAAMAGNRRVAMVNLMLNLLDPPMLAGAVGAVTATMFDTITPTPDAAPIAAGAVRVYLAQGRLDQARRWLDLAGRTQGPRLRPLAVLVGGGKTGGPVDTRAWGGPWLETVLAGSADEAAAERAAGVVALLTAVGADVSPEVRDRLPVPPVTAGEAFERLDTAAADGHQGEAILAALAAMGRNGPAATPVVAMARVAAALKAVGLGADALALARETAAAQVR